MNVNPFNICPSCAFISTCVLTENKAKVWSCSEFVEEDFAETVIEEITTKEKEAVVV